MRAEDQGNEAGLTGPSRRRTLLSHYFSSLGARTGGRGDHPVRQPFPRVPGFRLSHINTWKPYPRHRVRRCRGPKCQSENGANFATRERRNSFMILGRSRFDDCGPALAAIHEVRDSDPSTWVTIRGGHHESFFRPRGIADESLNQVRLALIMRVRSVNHVFKADRRRRKNGRGILFFRGRQARRTAIAPSSSGTETNPGRGGGQSFAVSPAWRSACQRSGNSSSIRLCRVGADPVEHVAEVRQRVDPQVLARRAQAHQHRRRLAPSVAPGEQPVLPSQGDRLHRPLAGPVVDLEEARLQGTAQAPPSDSTHTRSPRRSGSWAAPSAPRLPASHGTA